MLIKDKWAWTNENKCVKNLIQDEKLILTIRFLNKSISNINKKYVQSKINKCSWQKV